MFVRTTYIQIYLYNPEVIVVHEISLAVHILGCIRDEVDEYMCIVQLVC